MIMNLHCFYCKGHIQISQIPDRNEPSDDGKINFTSFFKMVEEVGYDGWVAGEYYASGEFEILYRIEYAYIETKETELI